MLYLSLFQFGSRHVQRMRTRILLAVSQRLLQQAGQCDLLRLQSGGQRQIQTSKQEAAQENEASQIRVPGLQERYGCQ